MPPTPTPICRPDELPSTSTWTRRFKNKQNATIEKPNKISIHWHYTGAYAAARASVLWMSEPHPFLSSFRRSHRPRKGFVTFLQGGHRCYWPHGCQQVHVLIRVLRPFSLPTFFCLAVASQSPRLRCHPRLPLEPESAKKSRHEMVLKPPLQRIHHFEGFNSTMKVGSWLLMGVRMTEVDYRTLSAHIGPDHSCTDFLMTVPDD